MSDLGSGTNILGSRNGRPVFDFTINLGHVLSMCAFLIAGGGAYYGTKLQLDFMGLRMEKLELRLDVLTKVTVDLARQDERLTNLGTGLMSIGVRVERLEQRVIDLRK